MLLRDAPMGVKLRLVEDAGECYNLRNLKFDYIIKSPFTPATSGFIYEAYSDDVRLKSCFNCLNDVEVEIMGRFKAGDIVKEPSGMFARIVADIEGCYVRTYVYHSPEEAADALPAVVNQSSLEGWELYTEPEEVTVSMEEIAEKFNIDVSKLRIKE